MLDRTPDPNAHVELESRIKGGKANLARFTQEGSRQDVTDLLVEWGKGDQEALNQLMPLVYDELHRLASRHLRHEWPGHTLQTTAVIHEAYLKLVDQKNMTWQNRVQFFAASAQVMRHILVDHARSRRAPKRGRENLRLSLDEERSPLMNLAMGFHYLETIARSIFLFLRLMPTFGS